MSFDVLVVGSGASGLAAAVSAEHAGARIAVAAKGSLQSCNSAKAQGGIQAAFGEDDSPEQHAEDVWRSSHETADRRLVTVLTSEAPSAIHWLEELGVEFTRENGGYRLARCGGASRKRLLQVGDRTGHAITNALREAFEAGAGTALTKSPLVSLERRENGWRAVCAASTSSTPAPSCSRREGAASGRPRSAASSRRTIPARPARSRRSRSTPAPKRATSTRCSTTRTAARGRRTCRATRFPRRRARTEPCSLNADGEEFTDSLGPRDTVAQAIFDEVAKGKGVETEDGRPAVYLDTTRISEHDAEISLPYMLRRYRSGGIDPLREPILTYPVLHYQNGGLVIDEHAETTLEGLYACGEIAGGTHGRNRMMGNSLLECCVFGRRAGRAAAEKAKAA